MALQQFSNLAAAKKPTAGRQSSGLMWRLLVFSWVVFFVMIATWVGLEFGFQAIIRSQIASVEKQANDLIYGVSVQEQGEVIDFYSRLKNIKSLLSSHIYMSGFLEKIQNNTDQGVYLTNLVVDGTNGFVSVEGVAVSYADLAQQMESFKQIEGTDGLELRSAGRGQDGRIVFTANFGIRRSLLFKNS